MENKIHNVKEVWGKEWEELLTGVKDRTGFFGYNNFYYWLKNKIDNIRLFPREVKWKIQRMNRGFSDLDCWGFDYYLTDVILGGIKQLKNNCGGYPGNLKNKKEWIIILDKIIYTFTVAKNVLDNNWYYVSSKNYNKKCFIETRKKASGVFHFMTLDECKKYENGWKLFQQYFFSLWN